MPAYSEVAYDAGILQRRRSGVDDAEIGESFAGVGEATPRAASAVAQIWIAIPLVVRARERRRIIVDADRWSEVPQGEA